jgi:hypothetical protein
MPAEQDKAIFLRFLDKLRKANLGIIDEVRSSNFTFYSPNYPNWPRGFEGARKITTLDANIFSDAQSTVEDIFAEGDKIVVRWTIWRHLQRRAQTGIFEAGRGVRNGSDEHVSLREW